MIAPIVTVRRLMPQILLKTFFSGLA